MTVKLEMVRNIKIYECEPCMFFGCMHKLDIALFDNRKVTNTLSFDSLGCLVADLNILDKVEFLGQNHNLFQRFSANRIKTEVILSNLFMECYPDPGKKRNREQVLK